MCIFENSLFVAFHLIRGRQCHKDGTTPRCTTWTAALADNGGTTKAWNCSYGQPEVVVPYEWCVQRTALWITIGRLAINFDRHTALLGTAWHQRLLRPCYMHRELVRSLIFIRFSLLSKSLRYGSKHEKLMTRWNPAELQNTVYS
jgi:hypothetical protein